MDPTQKVIRQLHAQKAKIDATLALLEDDPNVRKAVAWMASVGVNMPGAYKSRKARVGPHWTQKPENRQRVMDQLGRMAIRIDRRGTTTAPTKAGA